MEIRQRIDAYMNIVMRNVRDTVPKVIGYNLVRGAMNSLEKELFLQISSNEKLAKQLAEVSNYLFLYGFSLLL